jgi:23S rRNA pseudouridine2605 synthase
VLLATNDGDFANGLLHPRGGVPKTYVLKVSGRMMDADLERWRTGVDLDDGRTLPAEVEKLRHDGDKTWLEVTLREGRNQQIRRMGEATRFPVMRLARTSFAGITSEDLRPGQWRPLTLDELVELRNQYGVPRRVRGAGSTAGHPARGRPRGDDGAPPRPARGGPRKPRASEAVEAPRTPRKPGAREVVEAPRAPRKPGAPHAREAPRDTRGPRTGPRASGPRTPEKRRREERH